MFTATENEVNTSIYLQLVAAGESYEFTNSREVEEEMGIVGAPMEHLFTFYYEDNK
jgi:NADH pyrophosphatase NudC (nudix superfamily)